MSFVPDLKKLDKLELFPDEPDPISDVFGYHNFCENLVSAISNQQDTPFSILVHGEWGSGKTSVLVKTEANFKKLQENDANLNVILFEVWKYERVDPVATLLEEIKGKVSGKNSKRFSEIAKSVGLLLFDMAVRAHTNLSKSDSSSCCRSAVIVVTDSPHLSTNVHNLHAGTDRYTIFCINFGGGLLEWIVSSGCWVYRGGAVVGPTLLFDLFNLGISLHNFHIPTMSLFRIFRHLLEFAVLLIPRIVQPRKSETLFCWLLDLPVNQFIYELVVSLTFSTDFF
jgi:KAP family P-loop domain